MKKTILILAFLGLSGPISAANAVELKFNTQEFPPFNYEKNGVVAGPAVDVIKAVCAEMRIACSFRLLPWTRAQKEVEEGKANAMFVIGWNEERARWLHFSPPLMKTEYGFFVHSSNELLYRDLRQIQGYKVAVFGPSNTSNSLEKLRDRMLEEHLDPITIDMKYDDVPVFKMVNSGRRGLDGAFSNRDVGRSIVKEYNMTNMRYAGASKSLSYFIGFSKHYNDKALVEEFNTTFGDLYQKGIIPRILESYDMEPVASEER